MPPWHADPAHGEFLNDRRLSEKDKDTILKWVNDGALEGNPPTPQPTYATEWQIGRLDAVFSMAEDYPIPAEGTTCVSKHSRSRPTSPKTRDSRWK